MTHTYSWERLEPARLEPDRGTPVHDDEPRPLKRSHDVQNSLAGFFAADGRIIHAPHEDAAEDERRQAQLRQAQLAVTQHIAVADTPTPDEVEEARYWLAALGLIPDPYPPVPQKRKH